MLYAVLFVPLAGFLIARLVKRLKRVDLPTLGRPTSTIVGNILFAEALCLLLLWARQPNAWAAVVLVVAIWEQN